MLPPEFVVVVELAVWLDLLFLDSAPVRSTAPWLQEYVVLHQVGWWACSYLFHFDSSLPMYFLAAAAAVKIVLPS